MVEETKNNWREPYVIGSIVLAALFALGTIFSLGQREFGAGIAFGFLSTILIALLNPRLSSLLMGWRKGEIGLRAEMYQPVPPPSQEALRASETKLEEAIVSTSPVLDEIVKELNHKKFMEVLNKNFHEEDPGVALVMGVRDYFRQGSVGLGDPKGGSVLIVRDFQLRDLEIETEFQILDDGGDRTNWIGFLLRASNPLLGGGYLIYFRSDRSVELQLPSTFVMPNKALLSKSARDDHITIRIQVYKSLIRVFEGESTTPLITWAGEQIRYHGEAIFIYAYRTNTRFYRLRISRPVTER